MLGDRRLDERAGHINAIARHIGVKLDNDDWEKIGYDIPLLVNLQPAGECLGESTTAPAACLRWWPN